MAKDWQKGWPKGTRVRMVGNVREELQGKEAVVYKELHFNEEIDANAYVIYSDGQQYNIPASWLEFVKYKQADINWARNKVELLQHPSFEVFEEIHAEKQFGHFPNYDGDNDEQGSTGNPAPHT